MSKYPEKIDGSVEIPIIRNNITEATSDVINRLRQAIINIERAVGISPQGSKSSLSDRISVSIDENGLIKESALSQLNILSGQIENSDVSQSAKISESKIDLDYSTHYLRSSIIALESEISNTLNAINSISSLINLHTNGSTLNAHNAEQINLTNSSSSPASFTNKSISDENLQDAFERIYDEHINIKSDNITESNNAHTSDQIFYSSPSTDSESVSSVKEALDFILNQENESFKLSLAETAENSIVRFGNLKDNTKRFAKETLVESTPVSYISTDSDIIEIMFSGNVDASGIEVGDYIYLRSNSISDSIRLTIVKIIRVASGSDTISSVFVRNIIDTDDDGTTVADITKAGRELYNKNSLNTSFRSYSSSSSNSSVYIENPNSASVISSNFSLPTSSEKNISIEYENGTVEIDVYSASVNSIEYVIHTLNTYFCDNNIPLSSSKINTGTKNELCISHILPNSNIFSKIPYVKIVPASSLDFSGLAGFSDIINKEIYGKNENSSIINGTIIRDMFYPTDISSIISISNGSSSIDMNISSIQSSGIRKRNLIYIENEGISKGIYDIAAISGQTITFVNPNAFNFSKGATTKVFLFKNTISTEGLGSFGQGESSLIDIFIDEQGNPGTNIRANVIGTPYSGTSFVSQVRVVDISTMGMQDEKITLKYDTNKMLFTENTSGSQTGIKIYAPFSGFYNVPSPINDAYIIVEVITDSAGPTSEITLEIEGLRPNSDGVLNLSSVLFAKDLNYFSSPSVYGNVYIASSYDKRNFGSVGSNQVSSKFRTLEFNLPRSEINSNMVIEGFELSGTVSISGTQYNLDMQISEGIAYINGKRIYFDGRNISYSTADKNSIAIIVADSRGNIFVENTGTKLTGIIERDYIILHSLTPDGDYLSVSKPNVLFKKTFKIEKNIQNLITDVIVGTGGHFSTIEDAIRYFDAIYQLKEQKDSYKITLKNEEHIIYETIKVGQYSLEIVGTGSDCKIRISDSMALDFSSGGSFYNINKEISMFRETYYGDSSYIKTIDFKNINFDYTNISIPGVYCVLIIDRKDDSVKITDKISTKFSRCSFWGSEVLSNEIGDCYIVPFVVLPAKEYIGFSSYVGNLFVENCFFRKVGSYAAGGPIIYIGYDSTVTTVNNLPVDNIILRENIMENCANVTILPTFFYDGNDIDSMTSSSSVSMSKNFISLGNNSYNLL